VDQYYPTAISSFRGPWVHVKPLAESQVHIRNIWLSFPDVEDADWPALLRAAAATGQRRGEIAMRNFLLAFALAVTVILSSTTLIEAARNPSGTGQPGAECGAPGAEVMPPGFTTDGFAHAETVYAGSDNSASLAHTDNPHAVSQYDVACFQRTSSGH
jgi:hypothetical protein